MGGERRTAQNLRVVLIDAEQQMLLVNGAVPGARNGYVIVQASKKKG